MGSVSATGTPNAADSGRGTGSIGTDSPQRSNASPDSLSHTPPVHGHHVRRGLSIEKFCTKMIRFQLRDTPPARAMNAAPAPRRARAHTVPDVLNNGVSPKHSDSESDESNSGDVDTISGNIVISSVSRLSLHRVARTRAAAKAAALEADMTVNSTTSDAAFAEAMQPNQSNQRKRSIDEMADLAYALSCLRCRGTFA